MCVAHYCGKIPNSISLSKEWCILAHGKINGFYGGWTRKSRTRYKSSLSNDLLCHQGPSSTAFKTTPEVGDQIFKTWACGEHSRFNSNNMKLELCTGEASNQPTLHSYGMQCWVSGLRCACTHFCPPPRHCHILNMILIVTPSIFP